MASYLQIENISKSYGPKVLFSGIGFNINEGDKIALIAPNGTGKTSLLRILAGKDKSDSGGKITFLKDIRIAFLEQEYDFDPSASILRQIEVSSAAFRCHLTPDALEEYELDLRRILTGFNLRDLDKRMGDLSGGEVKRVALAQTLAMGADFYIMDEPTNHLDLDAIEFLEGWLSHRRCTLLMVTHDRYFLERVCNTIFELDHGSLYIYRGDYENYLEKRATRISTYNAETDKVRNILRRELEWMRSTPCARTGKAKYRKDAFYELKERSEQVYIQRQVDMSDVGMNSRLGNKVFDCRHLGYRFGDRWMLRDFSYNFARGERVGIVGPNGAGKTTFMNLLTGNASGGAMEGNLQVGDSVKIGYYNQKGIQLKESQTVLDTVPDTHLLSMFMFGHDSLANPVANLSGGEKRRLYLLSILIQKPNVLILDEPTNDLDIVTLNILEEYLLDFKGTLIIVSHDRHFLDRLVDHLFIFCGDGVVKDFIGGYTAYRSYLADYKAEQKKAAPKKAPEEKSSPKGSAPQRKKLSYKEQRELESLEADIEVLYAEKAEIETKLSSGSLAYEALDQLSRRHSDLVALLDEKELRWFSLAEN